MWKQRLTCNLVVFKEEDQLYSRLADPQSFATTVGSLGISEEIAQEHEQG
jgi:hypothetical protein